MRWCFLLVMGCARGGPPYVDALYTGDERPLAVSFASEEILDILYLDVEGRVQVGQLDAGDAGRGVELRGNEAFAPELDDVVLDIDPGPAWFDLQQRPGGVELWVYAGGLVGRFENDGTMQVLWDGREGQARRGALAFGTAKDVLHVGIEGRGYRQLMLDGDGFVVDEVEPLILSPDAGGVEVEGPLGAPCQLDASGERLFLSMCASSGSFLTTGVLENGRLAGTHEDGVPPIPQNGALAVRGEWMLSQTDRDHCVVPVDDPGSCAAARYVGPYADRASVSIDGRRAALLYEGASILLVEEDRPRDASDDLSGTWCRLSGDLDLDRLTLNSDRSLGLSLAPDAGGTEANYQSIEWRHRKGVLSIEFDDGVATEVAPPIRFEHLARRVGATLHIEADPTLLVEDGWADLSGTWLRQPGPDCDYGHTMLPNR